MKTRNLIIVLFMFCCQNGFSQHEIITKLEDFYAKSDLNCYEQKIQQDLNKFDCWLTDTLPLLKNDFFQVPYRPSNIDLRKEKKVFVLAVTLANTENYCFEDNIYDYLIIDSLRTFIVVCVDEKMNIKGYTDTSEPGTYVDLKDDFYYYKNKQRKRLRQIIRNINKENPDLILYCHDYFGTFLYIKGNKIYAYNVSRMNKKEFNEDARECPDINMIRKSNMILCPYKNKYESDSHPMFYSNTGHTPPNEVRICPPLLEPIK